MSWKHWLCDLRDGRMIAPIDIPSFSWTMSISDSGFQTTAKNLGEESESNLTLPWAALNADTPDEREHLLSSGRRALCSSWVDAQSADPRGTPILWGAIDAREDSWLDTSFGLLSASQLLDTRYAVRDGKFFNGHSTDMISFQRLSFRAIACALIDLATSQKSGGTLPFDLPYMGEKGSHERMDWKAWNVQNLGVNKLLTEMSNVQGGPDMTFRPRWSDDTHCRVQFLAGSDSDVFLDADKQPVVLNATPSGGSLQELKVNHSLPVQRVYATGAGTDEAVITALAQDMSQITGTNDPPVLRETTMSDTDCNDVTQLQSKAQGVLASNKPLIQITGSIDVNDTNADGRLLHPMGSFWPGMRFDLDITGHPTLPDKRYETRLMEMSGDQSSRVQLKFDVMPAPLG